MNLSLWLLTALLVIYLALRKQPSIPYFFAGVVRRALMAMAFQGVGLHDVFTYANSGYAIETGVSQIDSLLNRGGVQSMMWTIPPC